jgi:hypothetical protein
MRIFFWYEGMAKWPTSTLFVKKLQSLGYEQHTYAIIGRKMYMSQKMFSTHIHKQWSFDVSENPHVNS